MVTTKRTWVLTPHGMSCFQAPESYQTVKNLWEVTELAPFHDAELAKATKEINAIFSGLEKSNKDQTRTLSFVRFQSRLFLVWARYGAVGPWDDEETIIKELKLKME